MSRQPSLLGILNITEDSFSDGARFLAPDAALAHAHALAANGADILDLGAASSNPSAKPVSADVEIARLSSVVAAMKGEGVALSIDSFSPDVQRWALEQGVDYINDIAGFPHPAIYPALANSDAKLIVMHSVQEGPAIERVRVEPEAILGRIIAFFERRLGALEAVGIARSRLIVDPGMGLFLGTHRLASFSVLRGLGELKKSLGLPVLVSVSRKSFLRSLVGRGPHEAGAASLAAELFAARMGADYVRTHDPGALKDALTVTSVLENPEEAAAFGRNS